MSTGFQLKTELYNVIRDYFACNVNKALVIDLEVFVYLVIGYNHISITF